MFWLNNAWFCHHKHAHVKLPGFVVSLGSDQVLINSLPLGSCSASCNTTSIPDDKVCYKKCSLNGFTLISYVEMLL